MEATDECSDWSIFAGSRTMRNYRRTRGRRRPARVQSGDLSKMVGYPSVGPGRKQFVGQLIRYQKLSLVSNDCFVRDAMSYLNYGNSAEVGGFELASEVNERKSASIVFVKVASSVGIVGLLSWVFFTQFEVPVTLVSATSFAGLMLVYLGIAWLVRPQPNYNNMGWAGGLINTPFKLSDDLNRMLMQLKIVFWPGRWVTQSLIELATLCNLIEEVTHDQLAERKARELVERMDAEGDSYRDDHGGGVVELSSAKWLKN